MADKPVSYEQHPNSLPPERKGEVGRVWRVARGSVPEGYREEVTPKFLTFEAGDESYVALAKVRGVRKGKAGC